MKKSVIALALVAGCGAGDPDAGNRAAGNGAAPTVQTDPTGTAVATAALTGLYEGGDAARPDQLCVIDQGAGNARFGLVVQGEGLRSCSGAGSVVREGATLRLAMAGDEACAITARIVGESVILPAEIPSGCAYYCAEGASLANARFTRSGSSAADAMKAKDFAGDPLCGGAG